MKKQTPPDPERAEFIARFWEARREHVNPPPDGARPAHEALVALADQRGWAWLKVMAEASRLGGARQYEKALSTLGPNDEGVPEAYRSYALFVRASVHQRMKANEAAMQFYRSVLADAGFDRPGSVWYNIGVMLLDSGDFNGAEDANLEALKDPNFVARGEAWNNLGFALAQRGDSAGAIEAYEKAIRDPSVWGKGKAWNNLGVELARQENYPAAIKAYRRALATEGYESPARAWHNLGLVLKETGDVQEARKAFNSVLASPDIEGFHASARLSLMLLDTSLSSAVLSKDDQALLEKSPSPTPLDRTEQRLITKIQEAGDSQYDKYLRKKDSTRDGVLSILRGWSSAVTLLEGSERRWRGGGYFFKWRGHGVVLDPGFDFLRNFHDAGYHGREIQAVLVSHDHPDHNADLKGVDDLRYELFKRLANAPTPIGAYAVVWDEDTRDAAPFMTKPVAHHHPPIMMQAGFIRPMDLSGPPWGIPIRVTPFKAKHSSDVPNAMGMVVELLDEAGATQVRLGYTADTEYFDELAVHLKDCHILIAHISQPTNEELKSSTQGKKDHLGYRGTIRLMKECRPRLGLIGEFWAGFADLRIDLVKGIRSLSGCEEVFPAGIGMNIQLPGGGIQCTECGEYGPANQIRVSPPTDLFGNLSYLCPACQLG